MKHRNERLQDLLVDRATEGLDPEHQYELEALLRDAPEGDESFELAAAALELAFTREEPLPSRLRLRLEDRWRGFREGNAV